MANSRHFAQILSINSGRDMISMLCGNVVCSVELSGGNLSR